MEKNCNACSSEAVAIPKNELIEAIDTEIPEWKVIEDEAACKIQRQFLFKNFTETFAFVSKLALISEKHGHHPEITFGWGEVIVSWWSHKISAVHQVDVELAKETDELYANK